MGWGESHMMGTGTSQQIEDAHSALDQAGIGKGNLAVRVLEAVGMIDRLRTPAERSSPDPTVERPNPTRVTTTRGLWP